MLSCNHSFLKFENNVSYNMFKPNVRPAGDSSDEEDEFNQFELKSDFLSTKQIKEQIAREICAERRLIENLPVNKVYNAIVSNDLETLRYQLDNHFDVDSKVLNQFTPLHLAASLGRYEIVDELLKRGADPKAEAEGFTVLMAACSCIKHATTSENIVNIVEKLLEYDVNVENVDSKRRTALMIACEQGFVDVVALLEPLSDLEAEDNRGWTALFYAVDAKNIEIFTYLYNHGANYNHIDVRDNNVKYYATINEFYDISKVLPDDWDMMPEELIQNEYNYEEMFESLENNYRPSFKEDLSVLLYGMKCENLIPLFNEDDIDLNTFLTLDNDELETFGVNMSFQRNRILQGIYRFHEHSWKKTSIPFIPKNGYYTSSDLFEIVTTAVKHLVIMEATLDYMEKNYSFFNCDRMDIIASKINDVSQKFKSMKVIVKHLHDRAKKFDKIGSHPDIIKKGFSFKKNSLKKTITMSLVGISAIFYFVCCKMKFFK